MKSELTKEINRDRAGIEAMIAQRRRALVDTIREQRRPGANATALESTVSALKIGLDRLYHSLWLLDIAEAYEDGGVERTADAV